MDMDEVLKQMLKVIEGHSVPFDPPHPSLPYPGKIVILFNIRVELIRLCII